MFNRSVLLMGCLAFLALECWADEASTAPVYGITPKRLVASVAALIALFGVITGGWTLARSGKALGNIMAMVAGLIGILLGGFVVATADGGLGTGNGIAGGVVALVLGLIGVILGGWARARSRRTS